MNWLSASNMLPSVVPKARIWMFNYQSNWLGEGPFNRISTLADQLLEHIHLKLNIRNRPLIFVAHSFGGILVAEALTLITSNGSFAHILHSTTGLVFLGTPFRGSPSTKQAQIIVDAARAFGFKSTKALLGHLLPGSDRLVDLTRKFSLLASSEKLNIVCFFEQLRTPIIRNPSGLLQLISQKIEVEIVSELSACLDGYKSYGLNTTHTKMNKFNDPGDGNYQLVSGKILEFVSMSPEVLEARRRQRSRREPIFLVPYLQNPDFVGRDDILQDIASRMTFRPEIQARLALWGLGGVGKSQIATKYAYAVREAYAEQGISVFWIHAASRARFEESYLNVASNASIPISTDPSEDKLELVANWLKNEENGRWLMIIDNADDIDLFNISTQRDNRVESSTPGLSKYIPRCDHGSILFTSRSKSACLDLTSSNSLIHITKMKPDECVLLLRRTVQDSQLDEGMYRLISLLEHLPLALTQAAAFMCRNTVTTSDYLELYNESEADRLDLLSQEFQAFGRDLVPNAIAATWTISFNQIKEKEPIAAQLLSVMSFFDRQDIPKALLPRGECTTVQFEMALGVLQGYSMITASSSEKAYDMHRLIQISTRHWLSSAKETPKWIRKALVMLLDRFPVAKFRNWSDCARYLPHAQSVLDHVKVVQMEEMDEVLLLLRTAEYLYSQGRFKEAEKLQLTARDVSHKAVGTEHPSTLRSMSDLALTYFNEGQWKEAEAIQVEVLETCKRILGTEHPGTLASMNNLALTYCNEGRWKEAEAIQVEVLETRKRILGAEDPDTLTTMNNLASTYCNEGRWKEAEAIQVGVLETHKRILGAEHPDTLASMNNLALTYWKDGQWKEAEAMQVEVLETCKRILGAEHPDTLASMNNLALTYYNEGRWKKAEAIQVEVLETDKRILGAEHPATLTSMNNLALTYWSKGCWKEAEIIEVEVLETCMRILGLEHPDTLLSMSNLAFTYKSQGRDEEAIILMKQVVRLRGEKLDPDHPDKMQSIRTLDRWQKALEQPHQESVNWSRLIYSITHEFVRRF